MCNLYGSPRLILAGNQPVPSTSASSNMPVDYGRCRNDIVKEDKAFKLDQLVWKLLLVYLLAVAWVSHLGNVQAECISYCWCNIKWLASRCTLQMAGGPLTLRPFGWLPLLSCATTNQPHRIQPRPTLLPITDPMMRSHIDCPRALRVQHLWFSRQVFLPNTYRGGRVILNANHFFWERSEKDGSRRYPRRCALPHD
ncbi:hypothetical protein BX600DRAFT_71737 [Xylariales sp. PMI_506]|nr:hypothetical protein BX600DRAFT_71737 [Xylariales sp. PMI_506]